LHSVSYYLFKRYFKQVKAKDKKYYFDLYLKAYFKEKHIK